MEAPDLTLLTQGLWRPPTLSGTLRENLSTFRDLLRKVVIFSPSFYNLINLFFSPGFAVGFWPLPEAYWPDVTASSLPQRFAHPTLKFTCANQEPMVIENLPFDKYELEPSPLTLFILGRKQPNYCWQVFIQGSTRTGETGPPFGYLKVRPPLH